MIKLKFGFALLILSQLLLSKHNSVHAEDSPLNRFHHQEYSSFREYLSANMQLITEERNEVGTLLPGIVLDDNGNIVQVFTLNSLSPAIDESIMKLFATTNGFWEPAQNSLSDNKGEIIIVPMVFTFDIKDYEYKIDTSNFTLPVQKELIITLAKQPSFLIDYAKTKKLIRRYKKNMSKEKYAEASKDLIILTKREPLNVEYYSKLITLYSIMQDIENACYYIEFVKTYFKNQPEIKMPNKINCEKV